MGTRSKDHRRNRRARGGFAPFAAFVLLFAFALGQGGSLVAFAGGARSVPTLGAADGGSGTRTKSSGTQEASSSDTQTSTRDVASVGKVSTAREGGTRAAPEALAIEGGDVNLDFVAAGPFTYNHATGLGTYPKFGYNDRTISKNNGVVESLEGGDFKCGDLVTFFVQVQVEAGAGSGAVALDMSFGAETTGQPGLGFDDIVSVAINTPDDGNVGLSGNETATLSDEHLDTSGYDQVRGTVTVGGLEGGETAIVRIIVHLKCEVGASPTGNILNAIEAAHVVGGDRISVGQETVPMKQVGEVAQPGLDVNKTCPATATVGSEITYTIDIINTGNEPLDLTSVLDTVNGHAAVDITSSFTDPIAAGATATATYKYTVLASDPDPLPNSVAVSAVGTISKVTLTGNASCSTDITHAPGIDVTKTCPASVAVGEDIDYTITVQNTGNEALTGVTVTDTLLGDITGDFNVNFANPFPAGAVATATVTYEQQAGDPDPITNTVTATGTGADSGAKATDTASCTTDITHRPGIAVTKSCPAQAGEGDTVTYSITVTNTGNEGLEDVTVIDSVLGDLSTSFGDTLAVGASETEEFDYTVPAGSADPLVNVVTVSATGADSGTDVTASANCSVDILHPAIAIVKTVNDDTVPVGTTVTYTFVVTNTGDTTLFDISVDDDVLGHIGDIAVLEPGDSATLTADFVVGDEAVTNIAIARGHDVLGRVVEASDTVTVGVLLAESPTPPPPTTPFTGSETGRLVILSVILLGLGAMVVAATRRRRPEGGIS